MSALTIAQLTVGTKVCFDDDDPTDPPQIGTVVEPTETDRAQARGAVCGFEADDLAAGEGVVLVAWEFTDEPGHVVDRSWRWADELQLIPQVVAS